MLVGLTVARDPRAVASDLHVTVPLAPVFVAVSFGIGWLVGAAVSRTAALFSLWSGAAPPTLAQSPPTIAGTVLDATGAPVADATVTQDPNCRQLAAFLTDTAGRCSATRCLRSSGAAATGAGYIISCRHNA